MVIYSYCCSVSISGLSHGLTSLTPPLLPQRVHRFLGFLCCKYIKNIVDKTFRANNFMPCDYFDR